MGSSGEHHSRDTCSRCVGSVGRSASGFRSRRRRPSRKMPSLFLLFRYERNRFSGSGIVSPRTLRRSLVPQGGRVACLGKNGGSCRYGIRVILRVSRRGVFSRSRKCFSVPAGRGLVSFRSRFHSTRSRGNERADEKKRCDSGRLSYCFRAFSLYRASDPRVAETADGQVKPSPSGAAGRRVGDNLCVQTAKEKFPSSADGSNRYVKFGLAQPPKKARTGNLLLVSFL